MLTPGGHIVNIATKTLFSTFSVIVDVKFFFDELGGPWPIHECEEYHKFVQTQNA